MKGGKKMDPITQMNNVDAINKANVNTQKAPVNNTEMNGDSFLKLFIESLKNQDPMAPMDQAQMMGQLTQLTMIETVTNMKAAVDKLMSNSGANPIGDYVDLIGKKVKIEDGEKSAEGVVISVGKQGDNLIFEMANGDAYNVNSIVGVTTNNE
jgi:flagellar basal-body rod modification protein FlgD